MNTNEDKISQAHGSNLIAKVRSFVVATFPGAQENLSDDDSLLTTGIIDSMGILEIVTFIESELNVVFDDDDMINDNFESILKIAKFVETKSRLRG